MSLIDARTCKCCRKRKALSEFQPDAWDPKNKNSEPKVRWCNECQERGAVYSLPEQLEVSQLTAKGKYLQRTYDISLKEYERLYVEQYGLCAICHQPAAKEKPFLVVDHDHETGNVRGLLCNNCNMAIGLMRDNADTLRSAVRYLQASRTAYETAANSDSLHLKRLGKQTKG